MISVKGKFNENQDSKNIEQMRGIISKQKCSLQICAMKMQRKVLLVETVLFFDTKTIQETFCLNQKHFHFSKQDVHNLYLVQCTFYT
jgi:hypothetical protein